MNQSEKPIIIRFLMYFVELILLLCIFLHCFDLRLLISLCFLSFIIFDLIQSKYYKQKMSEYTTYVCKSLDSISSCTYISDQNIYEDTLLSKTTSHLVRLQESIEHQNEYISNEQKELQALISDISHQTKAPLASLKLITDSLIIHKNSIEIRDELLQASRLQINQLDFLLQFLVKTSRLETGIIRLVPVEFSIYDTLLIALSNIILSAQEKQLDIQLDCPEQLLAWHDSKWTAEALANILDNAVKYNTEHGFIHIKVTEQEAYVKIAIKNSGIGIASSEYAQVFQRFYRSKDVHNQPGLGIGLFLTREIITMEEGYILVDSNLRKDATFYVYLPTHNTVPETIV